MLFLKEAKSLIIRVLNIYFFNNLLKYKVYDFVYSVVEIILYFLNYKNLISIPYT